MKTRSHQIGLAGSQESERITQGNERDPGKKLGNLGIEAPETPKTSETLSRKQGFNTKGTTKCIICSSRFEMGLTCQGLSVSKNGDLYLYS